MRHRFAPPRFPWLRSTAAAVALALLPVSLLGQTIRGIVLEGGTSEPIAGALIELLRADSTLHGSTQSDRRGWFRLDVGDEGTYLLRPSHLSYAATGTDSVSVGKEEVVTVVLRMGRTAIPLEPLLVAARSHDRLSGFYDRAERGRWGRFIRREYIERRSGSRPSQLIRMAPGIRIVPTDNGLSNSITMRGAFGWCAADIFLDGLPLSQDIGMSIDDFTAADLLEGIEIYDAHTIPPPEFAVTTNDCGVIAFWSRNSAFKPLSWKRVIVGVVLGVVLLLSLRR